MRQAYIRYAGKYTGKRLDFKTASELAWAYARKEIIAPFMVAWVDRNLSRTSPVLTGCKTNYCWHDYGTTRGGKLELFINGEYDFIFADSSNVEPSGQNPVTNIKDGSGNEYLCQLYPKDDATCEEWECKPAGIARRAE